MNERLGTGHFLTGPELRRADTSDSDVSLYFYARMDWSRSQTRLAEAQNWRCAYCGVHMTLARSTPSLVTRDHVVPRCEGGSEDWDNLVAACRACNGIKSSITLAERFAHRRARMAGDGRWPAGEWPSAEMRLYLYSRLAEDEYSLLLDAWRARRGLSKPGKAERSHIREYSQTTSGIAYVEPPSAEA